MSGNASFGHFVRAALAIILVIPLPVMLFVTSPSEDFAQAYQDALAAVVAFYFGATSEPVQP